MHISDAESEILEVLWRKHPLTAEEIVERVKAERHWQEPTIKTLLARLLSKHAVSAGKDGRRYLYRPTVERAAYITSHCTHLLDRFFDGRVAPLVTHFAAQGKLTRRDVEELKRLISKMDAPGVDARSR